VANGGQRVACGLYQALKRIKEITIKTRINKFLEADSTIKVNVRRQRFDRSTFIFKLRDTISVVEAE